MLPDERGFSALFHNALHVLVSTGVSALPPHSVQDPSYTLTCREIVSNELQVPQLCLTVLQKQT